MVSNFEEVLTKFDNTTKMLDKISEDCQKYAMLLLVNSKGSESCSRCCEDVVADVKQVRMLAKKLSCNKELLAAIRDRENQTDKSEAITKRERIPKRNNRASSMKYLVQWEKVVEAQLAENAPQNEEQTPLLPKPVIKRRIRQFENKDTKRISSTAEFFLDQGEERPESCAEVIQEEEEEEEEPPKPKEKQINEKPCDLQEKNQKASFKPRIVDVVVSIPPKNKSDKIQIRNYYFSTN